MVIPHCDCRETERYLEKKLSANMKDSMVCFTGDALEKLVAELRYIHSMRANIYKLRIAYDPIDKAIKFKMNSDTWGIPFIGDTPEGE